MNVVATKIYAKGKGKTNKKKNFFLHSWKVQDYLQGLNLPEPSKKSEKLQSNPNQARVALDKVPCLQLLRRINRMEKLMPKETKKAVSNKLQITMFIRILLI